MTEPKKPGIKTGRPNVAQPKIIDVLETIGDMTIQEIADFSGINRRTVGYNLEVMLSTGLVHISGWNRPSDRPGDPSAVYRLGPGTNARKPRPYTKRERDERQLELRRQRRAKVRIVGRMKRKAKAAYAGISPFAAMAMQLGA